MNKKGRWDFLNHAQINQGGIFGLGKSPNVHRRRFLDLESSGDIANPGQRRRHLNQWTHDRKVIRITVVG
jgi:hypothetical protein